MGVAAEVRKRLRAMRGVVESPSGFCPRLAYWVNGKEIALFDKTGRVLQLRVGRSAIRAMEKHPRIRPRAKGSEWIDFRLEDGDETRAVTLARLAVRAHLPPKGVRPKPPPKGADLARRRRFH